MLTVVLRYGMGQRQRTGLDLGRDTSEDAGEPMEVDGVKAMVAGVKSRGVSPFLHVRFIPFVLTVCRVKTC